MLNIAALSTILTYQFGPDINRQWNRSIVLGQMLEAVPGAGESCDWAVAFSGATANVASEGEDVDTSEFTNDTPEKAHLAWATYRSAFQVSEQAIDAAASSGGDPAILMDQFGELVMNASAAIAKRIESDLVIGTGTRSLRSQTMNTIVGFLGGAIEATGLYAGLNPATYPEWASNVYENSSVDRPLTGELIAQAARGVFDDTGTQFRGFLATTQAIADKYEGLWAQRQQTSGPRADIGATDLAWRGRPIVASSDITAGNMLLLDPGEMQIRFLPFRLEKYGTTREQAMKFMAEVARIAGTSDGRTFNLTNIPVRVAILGKDGDSIKAELRSTVQLVIKRRNRLARIADIAE